MRSRRFRETRSLSPGTSPRPCGRSCRVAAIRGPPTVRPARDPSPRTPRRRAGPGSSARLRPSPPRSTCPRSRCAGSRVPPGRAIRPRTRVPRRPCPPPRRAPRAYTAMLLRHVVGDRVPDQRAQEHHLDDAGAEGEIAPRQGVRPLARGHLRPVGQGHPVSGHGRDQRLDERTLDRQEALAPCGRGGGTVGHDLRLRRVRWQQVDGLGRGERNRHDAPYPRATVSRP